MVLLSKGTKQNANPFHTIKCSSTCHKSSLPVCRMSTATGLPPRLTARWELRLTAGCNAVTHQMNSVTYKEHAEQVEGIYSCLS